MEAQFFLDFSTLACFIDKKMVRQYKLALVENNTLVSVEVVDGWNLSLSPITHETKILDLTIGFHTNKAVFNVISFLRNHVIIGLSWLVLHNPRVDWHTRSLHFETPQHEALECETLVKSMQNLKKKENLDGTRRPR